MSLDKAQVQIIVQDSRTRIAHVQETLTKLQENANLHLEEDQAVESAYQHLESAYMALAPFF